MDQVIVRFLLTSSLVPSLMQQATPVYRITSISESALRLELTASLMT